MTIDTSREAVERILDGVTEGPWESESGHEQQNGQLYWQVTDGRDAIMQNQFCWCQGDQAANARFIAAARELVPVLLAERDAALAEVARLSHAHAARRRPDAGKGCIHTTPCTCGEPE